MVEAVASDPEVQKAVANSVAKSVTKSAFEQQGDNDMSDADKAHQLQVTEEEFQAMKQWAMWLRVGFIVTAALMMIIGLDNMAAASSTEIGFLAFYMFLFSCLICGYELAFKSIAVQIATNFGFMYSFKGRVIFLIFVSIISYQLSVFGKIIFALLLVGICVYAFVCYKHPKFEAYMKHLHYSHGGSSGAAQPVPTTETAEASPPWLAV